ncbi:MAG TPA: acryloyl-CoA reductase [Acidimicrobiales bacterium]|nr:acryloyl-CoA reductase [Acidimicrobiales bacterium]
MKAFVVSEIDDQLICDVGDRSATSDDPNDVLVRVEYSSVNFKDAMVAAAPSRVRRVSSLVGGVDAAGTVIVSHDENVAEGDRVAVHGGQLGVGRDGGFATQVYAPSRYLSHLPETLSTFDAMIIGTAGFTAMASVLALEDRGLSPGAQVLVTGATGGVGSQAVTYLAQKGYQPTASTGSPQSADWLRERGAARVIARDEISDRLDRVLGTERWDGAIDCVGGSTLQQILRSLRYGASVAASGLVASAELDTTVYPFITRAVTLIGIDAVEAPAATRVRVWQALGEIASTVEFSSFVDRVISLYELPQALDDVRDGATRGRILVDVNAAAP